MSFVFDRSMSEALDRHITGNYGADQHRPTEGVCVDCGDDCAVEVTRCEECRIDEITEWETDHG